MRVRILRRVLAALAVACLPHPSGAAEPRTISNDIVVNYDVRADGQYVRTLHLERRAGTDDQARALALLPWQYDSSRESVDIVSAFTRKADGSKLEVDPATIQEQTAGGPGPDGTAEKEKLIRFRGVTAGDSVVVDIRDRMFRPRLLDVFSVALVFDPTQLWDATVTVSVPGTLKLDTEAVGPVASEVGDGANVTHAWRYRTRNFTPVAAGALAPVTQLPRLLVSTATSWQQIARAYAAFVQPQVAVTVQVDDTADVATRGLTDPRAIADHLYNWVQGNIRYVPVPFGAGDIKPHTADAVLTRKAGDSADQAVLLSALLKDKGIPSELALISLDNVYSLSVPVPFAQLNHVLLYVPEFGLYADPTAAHVRFGELPFNEYGKPAVYAVATGKAVGMIPVLAPGAATEAVTTMAHLTADDMIVGDSRTEATGPFAAVLRGTAVTIARADASGEKDVVANARLRKLSEPGTGTFDPPPPETSPRPYTVTGHFAVSIWPFLSEDSHLSLPDGLRVLPRPGDFLLGPLDAPSLLPVGEPTPCFAGQQVATMTLDLGPKHRVTQLPADRTIGNGAFSYTSHWSQQGQVVTVRRELVSRIDTQVCRGKLREETAAALHAIRQDDAETIALAPAK